MPEKKGLLSRILGGSSKPAPKPAPKPAAKPAAKPKSTPKPAPKPVAAKPAAAAPAKSASGAPPQKPAGAMLASSRPANRPQVKPTITGSNGQPRPTGAPPTAPSRPANRPNVKATVKPGGTPTATKPVRPVPRPIPRPAPPQTGPRRMAQELISASGKRTIRELHMQGQRVLLRVDFNVPLSDGKIVDDSRIRAAVPTIKALLDGGASVVIMSHLGRPDGRVVDGLRLRPAAERLTQLIRVNVPTTGDALGVGTDDAVRRLRPGELLLLENVRFHAGEERNDPAFAERLASYGDVFVNDAFGAAHRAHASTVGVAAYLPSYVGLLMEQEVEALSNLLEKPARPFAAIVGGGKVSGKVAVLEALIKKVDLLILGGGVANTFLVASGRSVGKSLYESKMVDDARRILKLAQDRGVRVLLPVDGVVAKEVTRGTEFKVVSTDKLPASWHMVDLGPASITAIREALAPIKTILWNGPLGVFEIPSFAVATRELAKVAAEKADAGATVVVGGGDSIAALRQLGVAEKMTHLSTGGGASLEFLEGRDLPGLAVVPTAGSPYETLPIIYVSPVKPGGKSAAKRAPAKPKPIIKPSALDDEDDESDTLA